MKILLLGKDGQLGWELQRSLAAVGTILALGRDTADLEKPNSLPRIIQDFQPDVIINAAAYTAVDKAESETEKARLVNTESVSVIAKEAKANNATFIHYSTDYIFDGSKEGAYSEDDLPNPLSVYGSTKLDGEKAIAESGARHLIFRTTWVFASRGNNFIKTMLRLAAERDILKIVSDQTGSPTSAALIADTTALILYAYRDKRDELPDGIYNLTSSGKTNWHEYAGFAIQYAQKKGLNLKIADILPISTTDYPTPAMRPKNSILSTDKIIKTFGIHMPDWQSQVRHVVDEICTSK